MVFHICGVHVEWIFPQHWEGLAFTNTDWSSEAQEMSALSWPTSYGADEHIRGFPLTRGESLSVLWRDLTAANPCTSPRDSEWLIFRQFQLWMNLVFVYLINVWAQQKINAEVYTLFLWYIGESLYQLVDVQQDIKATSRRVWGQGH